MIEYIFGYLDLQPGISYVLDNFNQDTPSPSDPYIIEYAFDDIWELAPGHRLDCRVLHYKHGLSEGHIWINKTTRQVMKQEGVYNKVERYVISKL
jgi:hypothetical protein